MLLSFLLSKTMVGPIEKLTAGAERVAPEISAVSCRWNPRMRSAFSPGTFNEMAGVLQSTLAAMENERNKLDTLFLHMTDGVVAFDHAGHLIHCNPAAKTMLQRDIPNTCTYEELFADICSFQDVLSLQRTQSRRGREVGGGTGFSN